MRSRASTGPVPWHAFKALFSCDERVHVCLGLVARACRLERRRLNELLSDKRCTSHPKNDKADEQKLDFAQVDYFDRERLVAS